MSGELLKDPTPAEQARSFRQQQVMVESMPPAKTTATAANLIKLFSDKIKARGARGIIGIQRLFKIMDDDGSHTLSEAEFYRACQQFKVGISEENMPTLFAAFDRNRDGTINIDEFLYAIRGPMS